VLNPRQAKIKKATPPTLFRYCRQHPTHSKIPQIVEVARTIKRHWPGIVNWTEKRMRSGIIESFNSLFQAAKAKARVCRKTETLKPSSTYSPESWILPEPISFALPTRFSKEPKKPSARHGEGLGMDAESGTAPAFQMIMPAATVSLVPSSMRMMPPVLRFLR